MKFWVGVATEMSFGLGMHKTLKPPVLMGTPTPSVEMASTHITLIGYATGANKLALTVVAGSTPLLPGIREIRESFLDYAGLTARARAIERAVVLDGSDIGAMSMDLTPAAALDNLLYPLIWPLSSRKAVFSSSIVKAEGKPIAGLDIARGLVMLSCGDPVKVPVAALTLPKPISAGMTAADLVLGVGRMAAEVAIDWLFSRLFPSSTPTADNWVDALLSAGSSLLKKYYAPKELAKYALKSLVGWSLEVICGRDPTFKLKVGPSFGHYQVEIGAQHVAWSVRAGPATVGETWDWSGGEIDYEGDVL